MANQNPEGFGTDAAETALARQIDLASLARALFATPADIHSFSENGLVTAVHADTPRYADWLYDIADFENLFATLPMEQTQVPALTTSLKAALLNQVLVHHNTTLGRLLKAALIGSLSMWRTSAVGLESFLLDTQQLNDWLAEELERPLDNYNFTMLARLLSTHSQVISTLSAFGFLPLHTGGPGHSKSDYRIAYDTVFAFRKRYVLLNGVAHAIARRQNKLRTRIAEQGIQPSFSQVRGSTTIVLYKRTPHVVRAIRQALDNQVNAEVRRLLDAPSCETPTAD